MGEEVVANLFIEQRPQTGPFFFASRHGGITAEKGKSVSGEQECGFNVHWFTGSLVGFMSRYTQRLNNSTNKHSLPGHSGGIRAEKGKSGNAESGDAEKGEQTS